MCLHTFVSCFLTFNMAGKNLASFSNTGRYYAHICDDGKLRIWDVVSCVLKQEFTPDVHLTSPYTDLIWISTSKKVFFASNSYECYVIQECVFSLLFHFCRPICLPPIVNENLVVQKLLPPKTNIC